MIPSTQPLTSQLREAWIASGLTQEALRLKARLECSADSLCRKLAGKQVMTTGEAEQLAAALGITLVWAPARPPRRRAA